MMPGREDYRVHIDPVGHVTYNFPTVLKSICRIQVMFFPFDIQKCNLTFGSWSHGTADLDFYPTYSTGRLGVFQLYHSLVALYLASWKHEKWP